MRRSLHLLALPLVASLAPACRDDPTGAGASTSSPSALSSAQRPIGGSIAAPFPGDLPGVSEAIAHAALPAGVALAADVTATEADSWGVELEWSVSPRFAANPPIELGAVLTTSPKLPRDAWRTLLCEGRVSITLGAPAFIDDRSELRASVGWGGALHVWGAAPETHYRVLPPGSLRAFLDEGRADVVPLAPARVTTGDAGNRFARPTQRSFVTTAYGTIELEQIVAPSALRPAPTGDARPPGDAGASADSLDGAGEPLCRLLLELVAADRVASGEPCRSDRVPVFADVAYVTGGGLTLEATSLRERMIPRAAVTFPPAGASLSMTAEKTPGAHSLVAADGLLVMRPRGEIAHLVLQNQAGSPRVALVDGVAIAMIPAGESLTLDARAGSYQVEWRTPIGELVDRAVEVVAPGRATAIQLSPTVPDIAAAIPSARIGP